MAKRVILGLIVVFGVGGCLPSTLPPPAESHAAARAARATQLSEQLAALPGAVKSGQLAVEYPGEVLFANGAVLPLPGGVEMLVPLAAVLREEKDEHWQGVVRAATGVSAEYDQALAKARAELLQRYLRSQGVFDERLTVTVVPGGGAPLSVALQEPASATSSAALKP